MKQEAHLICHDVPLVKGDRADLGIVYTDVTMDAAALNANHDTGVDGHPLRIGSGAIGAGRVGSRQFAADFGGEFDTEGLLAVGLIVLGLSSERLHN